MSRFYRKRKKKGFTLVELVVVMCIIGIIAGALIPSISGYIREAKKLKVLDQSRSVVMAVESYNLKNKSEISGNMTVNNIKNKSGIDKYLKDVKLDNLSEGTTVKDCYAIVNGAEFEINDKTEKLTKVLGDGKESDSKDRIEN